MSLPQLQEGGQALFLPAMLTKLGQVPTTPFPFPMGTVTLKPCL